MTDAASLWLTQNTQDNGKTLWLADENTLGSTPTTTSRSTKIDFISNRFDVFSQLQQQGENASFNDYDLSSYPDASIDTVYYRISKEKPVVHHVFNQANRVLKTGGILSIAGYKNEGTKTFIDKLKKSPQFSCKNGKDGKIYWAHLTKKEAPPFIFDDKNYKKIRTIHTVNNTPINSKPGLFGWEKIDQGSEFLISHLTDRFWQERPTPTNILDLGCGYGYLTLLCSTKINSSQPSWTLTDNNAAAIEAAAQNCDNWKLKATVIADDCAQGINEKHDLILCNPPFHQGFDVSVDLALKFLNTAKRLLSKQGRAIFVVNQFIPLETKAKPLFNQIERLGENKSFKVIALAH